MTSTLLKACGIWLMLLGLAIGNAVLREKVLAPRLGEKFALPLSGISFSILIFLATLLLLPLFGARDPFDYWLIGGTWFLMTNLFEFVFGHYVMGEPWSKLVQAYNPLGGNLWVLVLIVTLCSPYLAARLLGFV